MPVHVHASQVFEASHGSVAYTIYTFPEVFGICLADDRILGDMTRRSYLLCYMWASQKQHIRAHMCKTFQHV